MNKLILYIVFYVFIQVKLSFDMLYRFNGKNIISFLVFPLFMLEIEYWQTSKVTWQLYVINIVFVLIIFLTRKKIEAK